MCLHLSNTCNDLANGIGDDFNAIYDRLKEKPKNIELLTALQEYIASVPKTSTEIQERISSLMVGYNILDSFLFNVQQSDFSLKWATIGWPRKVDERIVDVEKYLETERLSEAVLVVE